MNRKVNIALGSAGLFVSIVIFAGVFAVDFIIFLFAGLSGDSAGTSDAFMVVSVSAVMNMFLTWQFLRLVQSKTHINGFILLIFLVLSVIFIYIPLDALHSYDSVSNTVVPRSILDSFNEIF